MMKISLYSTQFKTELDDYPGSAWEEILISLNIPECEWGHITEVILTLEDLKY